MGKTQYYTATSLDGFIADPDDSLEWLFNRQRDDDGALSYARFISDVGAIAMGATTYEWILDHEFRDTPRDDWRWPYAVPCWVFTHRDLPLPPRSSIQLTSDDVRDVHRRMVEVAGDRNRWLVGGGDLVGQFADAGLVDEVLVSIAPCTLGAGAPLLPRRLELRLVDVARNGDFACATYAVERSRAAGGAETLRR